MKSHKKIFWFITFRTFDSKSLCIRFNEIDEFIRVYNWATYLVLFGRWKYDFIYHSFRYLIGVKSGIMYSLVPNIPPAYKFL